MIGVTNTRTKILIEDVGDFNEVASDMFTKFLSEGFTEERGLIRPVTEDDDLEDEYIPFIYTYKGIKLADRMIDRLYKVGQKYFEPFDIDIKSHLYREM